jgi:hypothetical protein
MPKVKHAVVMRLKREITPEKVREIFGTLEGLRSKIPGLLDFSGGAYSSPEGLNQGFTHGFVMTFADEASRNGYLTHPDHEAVKTLIIPWLDGGLAGVVALDWLDEPT